jgi:hypothetical protein
MQFRSMSRSHIALAAAIAMLLGPPSYARPLDAVGHCPNGAQLAKAEGPYSGKAPNALSNPEFASAHATHSAGQPAWFAKLTGTSGLNRVFIEGSSNKVVVITVCDPNSCDRGRGYAAFDLATGTWGASLYLDGQVQELGKPIMPGAETQLVPHEVAKAIICAQNLDWGGPQ